MKLPKIEINLEELANKTLDEFEYKGLTIREWADKITSGEYQPLKYARWEICCDGYYPYCSNCRKEPKGRKMTPYCPNCGAKMDGEKADESKI